MVKKKDYSIKVENVTKKFKIYSDKPNTSNAVTDEENTAYNS